MSEPAVNYVGFVTEASPRCPLPPGDPGPAGAGRLAELLSATGTGDVAAFTEFYRATSHRVFGLVLRMLRTRAIAEEVTQEIYLQVWTTATRYDRTLSSPMGWLMMLAHRRTVDRIRSEQSADDRDLVWGHTHLGRDTDVVSDEVDQRLEVQAVDGCLDTLTDKQRQAIALAYYRGLTYSEVAAELDLTLPTVKSRIRGALKRLHLCLTGGVTDDRL